MLQYRLIAAPVAISYTVHLLVYIMQLARILHKQIHSVMIRTYVLGKIATTPFSVNSASLELPAIFDSRPYTLPIFIRCCTFYTNEIR